MGCKHCGKKKVVKNGMRNAKQNYWCKGCRKNFTELDRRRTDRSCEKFLCYMLRSLENHSYRTLADLFRVSVRTAHLWVKEVESGLSGRSSLGDPQASKIDLAWISLMSQMKTCGCVKHSPS